MRRMVKRMRGGAGPATESGAEAADLCDATRATGTTRIGAAAMTGIAAGMGFAASKETEGPAQCFSHSAPSSPMSAFICAMATGSISGPAHAEADTAACANRKARIENSAAMARERRLMRK